MLTKDDINENIKALNEAFITAAETHIEKKSNRNREFERSDMLLEMFKERKELYVQNKFTEAKEMTKKIRKQVKIERTEHRIKFLEEDLWFDVKKAKRGFVPTHTKLSHKDGRQAASNERPEILADFFGNTQWKTPPENQECRNNLILR